MLIAVEKINFCVVYYNFRHAFVSNLSQVVDVARRRRRRRSTSMTSLPVGAAERQRPLSTNRKRNSAAERSGTATTAGRRATASVPPPKSFLPDAGRGTSPRTLRGRTTDAEGPRRRRRRSAGTTSPGLRRRTRTMTSWRGVGRQAGGLIGLVVTGQAGVEPPATEMTHPSTVNCVLVQLLLN